MAHWRYYGGYTGAPVDKAYAAHILHGMTHNHQPEVPETVAIHIKEAQTSCNACPRWILVQHGVPTSAGTGIWTQLQLLVPHHTHAILTNHHCDQQGPLVATYTDIHRHPAGTLDNLRGHHNQSVRDPHADESLGPVRSPQRPVPVRPANGSAPHFPSISPQMRHKSRTHDARTQGYQRGVQSPPTPAPRTLP